jgi:hypothetical protein
MEHQDISPPHRSNDSLGGSNITPVSFTLVNGNALTDAWSTFEFAKLDEMDEARQVRA